jgi:hypothetical protein
LASALHFPLYLLSSAYTSIKSGSRSSSSGAPIYSLLLLSSVLSNSLLALHFFLKVIVVQAK